MAGETIKAEIRETENKQKEEDTPTKRIRKEKKKKRERDRHGLRSVRRECTQGLGRFFFSFKSKDSTV